MFIRAYLRASTDEQDANRSKNELKSFAEQKGVRIAAFYIENESGTKADRPELGKLLADAEDGDVLLIEKMDRLTRLPYEQWQDLKVRIQQSGLTIVVADQPMTFAALSGDEESNPIQKALTAFMLDLGAAMARDDYDTRRKRQAQGIEKAKAEGKYKGRKRDDELRANVKMLLNDGKSWNTIIKLLKCSRSTVASVARENRAHNAINNEDSCS